MIENEAARALMAKHRQPGRWVPGAAFQAEVEYACAGNCAKPIRAGNLTTYRRWEGLGAAQIVHVDCLHAGHPSLNGGAVR